MWGSSSGARSRTPGRPDTSSRETLISDEVVPISTAGSEDDSTSSDEKSSDVVAAVVVDEEAIVAGVRAAQYNMIDELRQLIDSGSLTANTRDSEDCTLLQWAAINNRKDIVQELLLRGADVNAIGGFLRESALQWAVRQGALEATVMLIQNGADPHLLGTEGVNAMHLALQFKHIDTVLFLCSTHPTLLDSTTSADKGSQTPLMFVVSSWGKQKATRDCARKWSDMLRILIAFGANVNAVCKPSGDTALHMVMRVKNDVDAGAMFRELTEGGARMDIANAAGDTSLVLATTRQRKTLARLSHRELRKHTVPSSTGFIAPWLQILSGAWLTGALGWFMGCALFVPTCGVLSMLADLTKASQNNISHGFAAGSMFFIVGSFFVYMREEVTSTLFLFWYVLSVSLLVFCFVKTTLTDPGFVRPPKRSTDPPAQDDIESGGAALLANNNNNYSASDTIRSLAISGDLHASLICSTCLLEKARRSKHCSTCGYCVSRFDHHCPFVNTCIGRDNIGYFMGFLVFSSLAIGSHLCIALPYVWNNCDDSKVPEDETFERFICAMDATPNALIVITGLALIHFIWITILGLAQLCQICIDITTYESIRGDKRETIPCSRLYGNFVDILLGRPSFNDREYLRDPVSRAM